ncbi:MAG: hypothetical protein ACP5KM_05685, partial [Conexivisphaera sp.]
YDPQNGYIYVTNKVSGTVSIISTTVSPAIYAVTFVESGLPSGTQWSITLNGTVESSRSNIITFIEPSGLYYYSVGSVPGYSPAPSLGSARVSGQNISIAISFTALTPSQGRPTGVPYAELYGAVGVIVVVAVVVLALLTLRRH